jgi:hypothetical protein
MIREVWERFTPGTRRVILRGVLGTGGSSALGSHSVSKFSWGASIFCTFGVSHLFYTLIFHNYLRSALLFPSTDRILSLRHQLLCPDSNSFRCWYRQHEYPHLSVATLISWYVITMFCEFMEFRNLNWKSTKTQWKRLNWVRFHTISVRFEIWRFILKLKIGEEIAKFSFGIHATQSI